MTYEFKTRLLSHAIGQQDLENNVDITISTLQTSAFDIEWLIQTNQSLMSWSR